MDRTALAALLVSALAGPAYAQAPCPRAVALSTTGDPSDAVAAALDQLDISIMADASRCTMRTFLTAHPRSVREADVRCLLGRLLVDVGQTSEAREHFQVAASSPQARAAACGAAGLRSTSSE